MLSFATVHLVSEDSGRCGEGGVELSLWCAG